MITTPEKPLVAKESDSPALPWRVITVLSSEYPTVKDFDKAIESKIAEMENEDWSLEDMKSNLSTVAIVVPVADTRGRILNSGGQPSQMELRVIQTMMTQLYFMEGE